MDRSDVLYLRMAEAAPSKLFSQEELQQLMGENDLVKLLTMTQSLIDRKMMKLIKVGEELRFQAILVSETKKLTQMTDDEQMLYSYIEALGREGIWTKTLKAKTNLHQHIVMRSLKLLENQRYIKLIKSVKYPTRKIYMLYNLQPSIDVTGGPWFTDLELDTDFIDSLSMVVWRYIANETFPSVFKAERHHNVVQSVYPASHTGFASLDSVVEFVAVKDITTVKLATNDIRSICELLVYDDKIELVKDTADVYKATWQSVLEAGFGQPDMAQLSERQRQFVEGLDSFSVFDHYKVIEEKEEAAEDVSYLDAWARS